MAELSSRLASYNTHASAQTSAERSTTSPRVCSGDMYPSVPRMAPGSVPPIDVGEIEEPLATDRAGSQNFASPKSSTLAVPSRAILMFAGFRSR